MYPPTMAVTSIASVCGHQILRARLNNTAAILLVAAPIKVPGFAANRVALFLPTACLGLTYPTALCYPYRSLGGFRQLDALKTSAD